MAEDKDTYDSKYAFILEGGRWTGTTDDWKRAKNWETTGDGTLYMRFDIADAMLKACNFALSVLRANGIYESSERMAVEKLEQAMRDATQGKATDFTTEPSTPCPYCGKPHDSQRAAEACEASARA